MYGPLASAEKVESRSTFSADASGPYIVTILFYTRKGGFPLSRNFAKVILAYVNFSFKTGSARVK